MDEGDVDGRLTLVVVVDVPPEAVEAFRAYEDAVLPLLPRHGGRLERRLRSVDRLAEVHVLSFSSRMGYKAFRADPERARSQGLLAGVTIDQRLLEVEDVPEEPAPD